MADLVFKISTAILRDGTRHGRTGLLNSLRPDLLRFMPALNVSREVVDMMIAMLAEVLENIAATEGEQAGMQRAAAKSSGAIEGQNNV